MKIYEISMLVFLQNEISSEDALCKIGEFIDSGLAIEPELLELHNKNIYKNYCFCSFFPLERDKIYKAKKNYTVKIRTTEYNLAKFFSEKLIDMHSRDIKGLTADVKIINKRHIEKIYSITPSIMKTEGGYWKGKINLENFERRLKENLVKKYNQINRTKVDEEFDLFTAIKFDNRKPVPLKYKGMKFLGDKVTLTASDDKIAQELLYMALGTGILELNARGAGFMNVKWL